MKSIIKLAKSVVYKEELGVRLNTFTLQMSDKTIQDNFLGERFRRFKMLFTVFCVYSIFRALFWLVNFIIIA